MQFSAVQCSEAVFLIMLMLMLMLQGDEQYADSAYIAYRSVHKS